MQLTENDPMLDYGELEKRWQKAWADAKVFEPEPNDKEGYLITFAFPYPNSPLHAGHMKTYSLTDSYARYLRMKGNNVMLPSAFHQTGTPVLGMAKRLAAGDEELISDFKNLYKIPESEIPKMRDPLYLASYFTADAEAGMREAGLGIDWRRKFNTIDPDFSKFVEWQFFRLKDKGLLTQGTHPVGWCTNENNAVGSHDTRGGVQPSIEQLTVIKFKEPSSGVSFACATYRPETVYGVTNIFVNDNALYVIADIDGAQCYISKEAAASLSNQSSISVKSEISGKELLQKTAINPVTKEQVPVLPGFFVQAGTGTGVVMSVPAHAPFDYAALERLKASGYPIKPLDNKRVIELKDVAPKNKEIPALGYLELLGNGPDWADDVIEKATKEIYRDESRHGVMISGKYAGKSEAEARDLVADELLSANDAFRIYTLSNEEPVICRCGTKVVVKVVSDQWFINYGDKGWKAQVKKKLPSIRILPEKLRPTIEYLVDWLDMRAAERAQGLGTKFPFNPTHIIEPLSDSTIYPIYYTFVNILRDAKVQPDQLKPELFDYIVNGKGSADDVSKLTGIDKLVVQKCRDSYKYWYNNTSNHSSTDLLNNHFMMYIFNHVTIVEDGSQPRQIVPNGLLMYEGEKMSKSIGNTVPVRELIAKHGSDPVRFSSIATADLDSETNYEDATIASVKQKNAFLADMVERLDELSAAELSHIDYWLYSKLNSKIGKATEFLDTISFRSAYNEIYYNSIAELKWYFERGGKNELVVREFLEKATLMLGPAMPHVAEELWHKLGKSTFVAKERWPEHDASMINKEVESIEQTIANTMDDIASVIELTAKMPANKGKKVSAVSIIVADDWKTSAYNALADSKSIQDVISGWPNKNEKEKISKFLSKFASKAMALERVPEVSAAQAFSAFNQAKDYISKRIDAAVSVELEPQSKSQRAQRALPGRPSIEVIWR